MTLSLPSPIQKAEIVDRQLVFPWDEWNLRPYYDHDAEGWHKRLSALSIRAQLALAMASGEWVCHRFSSVDGDARPLQLLEAGWAGVISLAYVRMSEPVEKEWRGPTRGPLYIVMLIVTDAFNNLDMDPDGSVRALWMHNLAQHVLPRTDAYHAWFREVVQRLERHYARPEPGGDDLFSGLPPGMGVAVPRDLFDTSLPFDPVDADAQIDAFLRGLAWRRNEYLSPPEAMSEDGFFEGTPYRYP
jgi:hypothetical protein